MSHGSQYTSSSLMELFPISSHNTKECAPNEPILAKSIASVEPFVTSHVNFSVQPYAVELHNNLRLMYRKTLKTFTNIICKHTRPPLVEMDKISLVHINRFRACINKIQIWFMGAFLLEIGVYLSYFIM